MDAGVNAALRDWISSQHTVPLCLVISPEVQSLGNAALEIASDHAIPHVDIGSVLPGELQDIPFNRRTFAAERWCENQVRKETRSPLLLANIDLLFHPELGTGRKDRLDPLALFRRLARLKPLLVLWPGEYHDKTLSYAVSEHRHYCYWPDPEAHIIQLSGH